ncbi:hypothetical protein NQ042_12550 [Corynebacterium phoceense]|uniref:hypothetical protein n=1 Tax=Corynebacterium phoceense TaxID=1686286 RepID=UPI00211C69C4|nr:hypothetical protein [Corynebacterium phoceense]MCQ9334894.1 hypothetical protein [Corynebacterium phoceense]MCQ9337175.1 hypothetical protein [Corynebacterium phoceense]
MITNDQALGLHLQVLFAKAHALNAEWGDSLECITNAMNRMPHVRRRADDRGLPSAGDVDRLARLLETAREQVKVQQFSDELELARCYTADLLEQVEDVRRQADVQENVDPDPDRANRG